MASYFRNICAKNRQNPLILLKVTIDNVGVPFLRHSVSKETRLSQYQVL